MWQCRLHEEDAGIPVVRYRANAPLLIERYHGSGGHLVGVGVEVQALFMSRHCQTASTWLRRTGHPHSGA